MLDRHWLSNNYTQTQYPVEVLIPALPHSPSPPTSGEFMLLVSGVFWSSAAERIWRTKALLNRSASARSIIPTQTSNLVGNSITLT